MPVMSPKLSSQPTPTMRRRLVDAGDASKRARTELEAAVLAAVEAGVSDREIAALADVSTNTVTRWKKANR